VSRAWPNLSEAAVAVLGAPDPAEKLRRSHDIALAWRAGRIPEVGTAAAPVRPARPARPKLRAPREVPRRRITRGIAGRGALIHAVAHIELNAVDLAWDIIARFAGEDLPRGFADDWVTVADEEAKHFGLLAGRLGELGLAYGDLVAHDGLWEAAEETSRDLLARLAVVPLVLEARGLDVTPAMIAKLEAVGDTESAALLKRPCRGAPRPGPRRGLAGLGPAALQGRAETALQPRRAAEGRAAAGILRSGGGGLAGMSAALNIGHDRGRYTAPGKSARVSGRVSSSRF
jgi:uncharacterized ferritin-like protein (DUF455 family)